MTAPNPALEPTVSDKDARRVLRYYAPRLAIFGAGLAVSVIWGLGGFSSFETMLRNVLWIALVYGLFLSDGVLNILSRGLPGTAWRPLRPLYWGLALLLFGAAGLSFAESFDHMEAGLANGLIALCFAAAFAILSYAALGGVQHRALSFPLTPLGATREDVT